MNFDNVDKDIQIEYCQLVIKSKVIKARLMALENHILSQSKKEDMKEINVLQKQKEVLINGGNNV